MNTSITKELVDRITTFGQAESISLWRALLWAEAWASRIPRSHVHITPWNDRADGGIDARVDDAPGNGSVIFAGKTRYQIKTGASFKPWQRSVIEEELFVEAKRKSKRSADEPVTREDLKPGIRTCLDANGTYVLVCCGVGLESNQRDQAEEHLRSFLVERCGYQTACFRVFDAADLAGFVEPYEGITRDILEIADEDQCSHRSWALQAEMQRHLELDAAQGEFVASLARELREDRRRLIRICGEPGIGKTRLVLEATRDDDLAPLVSYWSSAEKFVDSGSFRRLLHADTPRPAVLVIDECSPAKRAEIWDKLKLRSDHVRIMTIYHEFENTVGDDVVYPVVPPLDEAHIEAIIRRYEVPEISARRFAHWCSGSPRVAHVVGENLRQPTGDLLALPTSMQDIWTRYVCGRDLPQSESARLRKLTLTYLALFKRFGYSHPVATEAKAIAEMLKEADGQITWDRFQQIVSDLREDKILQGTTTLYISPKLLHVWLWREWWRVHESGMEIGDFVRKLPGQLFEWFGEMFRYAEESQAAAQQVDRLLGPEGPFRQGGFLETDVGARFFFWLAEAQPVSALGCLEATIGCRTRDELQEFVRGRGEVVAALAKIAFVRESFSAAARMLLALAEAENESWGNNASNTFTGLFSPGHAAPTEASPAERFPILVEALDSASPGKRRLGLLACDKALMTELSFRDVGPVFRGLRVAQPWTPQSRAEVDDAYRRVWELLRTKRRELLGQESLQAETILLEHAARLIANPNLMTAVCETLVELANDSSVPAKQLLTQIIFILRIHGDRLDDPTIEQLKQVQDRLGGHDFSSRLHRYVGMLIWDERSETDDAERLRRQIRDLAQEAVRSRELLKGEFPWLLSDEAEDAYSFGKELASHDAGYTLLDELMEQQRTAGDSGSIDLLAGYLSVVAERDVDRWEQALDQVANDPVLAGRLPIITRHSGFSERAAARVLQVIRRGAATPLEFGRWSTGHAVDELSEPLFRDWMDELLKHETAKAVSVALELLDARYEGQRPLPCDLALRVLLHERLFSPRDRNLNLRHTGQLWAQAAERFVTVHADRQVAFLEQVLGRWLERSTFFDSANECEQVLDRIVRREPVAAWRCIVRFLSEPRNSRTGRILRWLQGEPSGTEESGVSTFAILPQDEVFAWVDADAEARAPLLARHVPRTLDAAGGGHMTRALLSRFGDREDVRTELICNFHSGCWTGRRSASLESDLIAARRWRNDERNARVSRWLDEYIASLESQANRELVAEERSDRW